MEQINNLLDIITEVKEKRILDIIIAIIIIILSIMISSFFASLTIKIFKLKENHIKIKKHPLYKSIKGIFILIGIYFAILVLKLPEDWFGVCKTIVRILIIWEIAKTVANLISPDSNFIKKIKASNKVNEDDNIIKVLSEFGKYLVYIVAGFLIISELHYDISSLVTGLGLTSVVIALAAQDLVGSLLSGIAIASDKPFVVGDFVKIGSYEGTVTEIKFRCTRIRTVEDTIVTIHNSTIANTEVVNYTKMTKRRHEIDLNLPLETKSEDLERVTVKLKEVLEAEEKVNNNSVRVYFNDIDSNGIKMKIYLYTSIVDYDNFLEFKTKMNLLVIETLEKENIRIAYTGENIYLVK